MAVAGGSTGHNIMVMTTLAHTTHYAVLIDTSLNVCHLTSNS